MFRNRQVYEITRRVFVTGANAAQPFQIKPAAHLYPTTATRIFKYESFKTSKINLNEVPNYDRNAKLEILVNCKPRGRIGVKAKL